MRAPFCGLKRVWMFHNSAIRFLIHDAIPQFQCPYTEVKHVCRIAFKYLLKIAIIDKNKCFRQTIHNKNAK